MSRPVDFSIPSWVGVEWRDDVDLIVIPGDHFTVFSEPGVSIMAKCIQTAMRSDVDDAVYDATDAHSEMVVSHNVVRGDRRGLRGQLAAWRAIEARISAELASRGSSQPCSWKLLRDWRSVVRGSSLELSWEYILSLICPRPLVHFRWERFCGTSIRPAQTRSRRLAEVASYRCSSGIRRSQGAATDARHIVRRAPLTLGRALGSHRRNTERRALVSTACGIQCLCHCPAGPARAARTPRSCRIWPAVASSSRRLVMTIRHVQAWIDRLAMPPRQTWIFRRRLRSNTRSASPTKKSRG